MSTVYGVEQHIKRKVAQEILYLEYQQLIQKSTLKE